MSSEHSPAVRKRVSLELGTRAGAGTSPAPHPRPTFRAAPLAVPMTAADEALGGLDSRRATHAATPQSPVQDGHSPLQAVPLVKGAQGCVWVLVVEVDGGSHEQKGGVGHIHTPAHLPVQLSHDRVPVRHSCSWPEAGAAGGRTPRGNRQAQRQRVRPPRAHSSSGQDGPSCLCQAPLGAGLPTSSGTSRPSHQQGNRGQKWGQVRQAPWGDAAQGGSCLALPTGDIPGPALPWPQCSRDGVCTPPQCRGVGWLCRGHLPPQGHEAAQVDLILMTPPTSPGGWWSQQRVQIYLGQHWAWVLRAAVREMPRGHGGCPSLPSLTASDRWVACWAGPGCWPEDQLAHPHVTLHQK